jgi:hypothetical protein
MKHILTTILAFCAFSSIAQQTFVRQNVTTSIYYSIGDVFSNALDGDTIYLPGGAFSIGNLNIEKQLYVFGVGHHPDSTNATYATTLTGTISIFNTGSNGSFTGVYLNGTFRFGTTAANQAVVNYSIERCNVTDLYLGYNPSIVGAASNINVRENIVRSTIRGCNAQFVNFENNLIQGSLQFLNGNVLVRNNTFIGGTGCPSYCLTDLTNVTLESNVFMNNGSCANITINGLNSCIFTKNVFNANYTFPFGTNIGSGNMVNIPATGFFVNETNYVIEYTDDLHLASPALYLGVDGNQAGIYGGYSPFKPGSVPINPHISTKVIAPQTTPTGDLNINITVGAQDN